MLCHEIGEKLTLVEPVANFHLKRHGRIGFDRTDTVNARNRCHDDDVIALDQRTRCCVAHPVDLFVYGRFFFDIGIRPCHIGFRLIVIVIGNEIFDGIVRKEVFELAVKLRRKRLVRRKNKRRTLRFLNDLRHGEGLTGAGDAEQNLCPIFVIQTADQVADRGRLVARWLEARLHLNRNPAFGFGRTGRAVRCPKLTILEQRIAGFNQVRQRFDGSRGA